jgi:imidazole glycerol-phosphate synthase subunit HisH
MLLDESDEFGSTAGLGLIGGRVIPIPNCTADGVPHKIPHIGWNSLHPARPGSFDSSILEGNAPGEAAYFVHSLMAVPSDATHRIADCFYGGHRVAAVIGNRNLVGCQFHPEKSGEVGLDILRRFMTL